MFAGKFGGDDLATHRGGSFLTTAVIGAVWTINIMVTGRTCLHVEILAEVAAHSFAEKLFPAVTIFRLGRIRIGLFQSGDLGIGLLVRGIDASRRRIEITSHTSLPGSHEQMGVDEHRK